MLTSNQDYLLATVIQFALILTRFSAAFVFTPMLARQQMPNTLKIGFSLVCAFVFINIYPPTEGVYPYNDIFPLLFAVIGELCVGLVIGFVTLLFFNIVYTAGHVIDMQIGFSMAQVYDSSTGGQIAVTASLLNVVLVVSFLFRDGLGKLMYLLGRTLEAIPVGTGFLRVEALWMVIELFTRCFALSLQISMPVLASALLTEVALGVVVRTAPQMNVFVVGIPLKIIVGLVMLFAMIPVFVNATDWIFDEMFLSIETLLEGVVRYGT